MAERLIMVKLKRMEFGRAGKRFMQIIIQNLSPERITLLPLGFIRIFGLIRRLA